MLNYVHEMIILYYKVVWSLDKRDLERILISGQLHFWFRMKMVVWRVYIYFLVLCAHKPFLNDFFGSVRGNSPLINSMGTCAWHDAPPPCITKIPWCEIDVIGVCIQNFNGYSCYVMPVTSGACWLCQAQGCAWHRCQLNVNHQII